MKRPVSAICLTFLTACTLLPGEPGQAEVDRAVREAFGTEIDQAVGTKVFGIEVFRVAGLESIVLEKVEKVSCIPDGKKASVCEVMVVVSAKIATGSIAEMLGVSGKKETKVLNLRFVKVESGWIVANP